MDNLDISVLREFMQDMTNFPRQSDIRKSFRKIAKSLRTDEDTIRNRIEGLHRTGFLRGWQVGINPCLLGQKTVTLVLDVPLLSSKGDVLRKLRLIPGILTIVEYMGASLSIVIIYETEEALRKQIELISRISNTESLVRADIPFPQCTTALSRTDWEVVRTLRGDPWKPYNVISKEIGVSSRTVKRRLARMISERALFMIPSIDTKSLEGAVAADLMIFYTHATVKDEVDRKLVSEVHGYLIRAELGDVEHALFNLIFTNVSKAHSVLNWVNEQRGIRYARMDLVEDRIELDASFDEVLEKKIAQVQRNSAFT